MSKEPAEFRPVDIPLSQVNDDLMRCPSCGGTRIRHEGDFLRHYTEEFNGGESADIDLADRCKLVTSVSCYRCQITFRLVPDDIFNEQHENMRVRVELAKRDGLLQLNEKKPAVIQ